MPVLTLPLNDSDVGQVTLALSFNFLICRTQGKSQELSQDCCGGLMPVRCSA